MKINFYDFRGQIITATSKYYEQARQEWNRAIDKFPIAIAYCESIGDIREAIKWARKYKVRIRIRSGGHNYEGYSTGNKVLVVDISRLNQIYLDETSQRITIGAGVKNTELYHFISAKGYPFPGGTCPTVGVSGYCLGGGWGYSSRFLGLGCDSLVEIKMINYEGKLITANNFINSDLFWACKGAGGGNFGVIVELTFKLPDKVQGVTLFTIYHPNASKETQVKFLDIWQRWIKTVDSRINMNGGIYNSQEEGVFIYGRGIYYGTPEQAQRLLVPFDNISGMTKSTEYLAFLEAIEKIEKSYPSYEYFKSTGRFVDRIYSRRELATLVQRINEPRPQGSILTALSVYGLGGKVGEVDPLDTAFYYRNAYYILGIQSVWEDNKYKPVNVDWVDNQFCKLYKLTKGSYVNFPYGELVNYQKQYYGNNIEKLQGIKEKYDPYNIFRFPQSIRVKG